MAGRSNLAAQIADDCERLGVSNLELAAVTGVSIPTAAALRDGKMPDRKAYRRKVEAAADRLRRAAARTELTLPLSR